MSSIANFVQVVIASPLRQHFDYLPEANSLAADYLIGSRVQVPFGRRTMTGIVVGHSDSSDVPDNKLKAISAKLDTVAVLDSDLLDLAEAGQLVTRQVAQWYEGFDLLLMATVAEPPNPHGGVQAFTGAEVDAGLKRVLPSLSLTRWATLTGPPAATLPIVLAAPIVLSILWIAVIATTLSSLSTWYPGIFLKMSMVLRDLTALPYMNTPTRAKDGTLIGTPTFMILEKTVLGSF